MSTVQLQAPGSSPQLSTASQLAIQATAVTRGEGPDIVLETMPGPCKWQLRLLLREATFRAGPGAQGGVPVLPYARPVHVCPFRVQQTSLSLSALRPPCRHLT